MAEESKWKDAILEVLGEADGSLHYKIIWERIREKGLRKNFGKTPEQTVAAKLGELQKAGLVLQLGKGFYESNPEEPEEPPEPPEPENAAQAVRIEAYGLFWRSGDVDWNKAKGDLRGADPDNDKVLVDFASQEGIYLLHHHNTPTAVYVGMTSRAENGLYHRLRDHTMDQAAGRWETFSWFGFRPVDRSGNLGEAADVVPRRRMIEIIEAILIETMLPGLNRKFPQGLFGPKYDQVRRY